MTTPASTNNPAGNKASAESEPLSLNYLLLASPLGTLRLWSNGRQLVQIEFGDRKAVPEGSRQQGDAVLQRGGEQLQEYFAGTRRRFDLPLAPQGTAFQQSVWRALAEIPWGQWRSYADIARAISRPRAVRAVGAANGRNPLPIVVPCHRVVGSDGSLTGFAGGLEMKRYLLELEGSLRHLKA
ncbi:MAG: methylated-DNA--[protein]-cysteine S-methyltransferase [Halieaceae bacterium]|nr:methylated-DNA--[protein]-cysteine S-methyltransferase [Halieaceae bacterium]MCP5168113.1 methylated-DNA--[protein]-cysteine S-methyltransferase [Pseudomonadales bacterium]